MEDHQVILIFNVPIKAHAVMASKFTPQQR